MTDLFLDGNLGIARYDTVEYPQFEKLTKKQLGFFWLPEEVNLSKDSRDFKGFTEAGEHIFTSNLKRQILLDSIQGRAPAEILGPITSVPEVESFIMAWTFMENIHSRSYSHIIQNIYPNPDVVFDGIMDIPEIQECSTDISRYYDDLEAYNTWSKRPPSSGWDVFLQEEHRKKLWLCLNSINALEGIRFYVSFAASWAFAENKLMEGNAKIIKLIARDENVHLAFTQQVIKTLKRNPVWQKIADECQEECEQMFISVVEQERAWAEYLFKYGSIVGYNYEIAVMWLEHLAEKRMSAVGLKSPWKKTPNPLPWTTKWIAGEDVQLALQETENTSYLVGAIDQNISDDFLGKLSI